MINISISENHCAASDQYEIGRLSENKAEQLVISAPAALTGYLAVLEFEMPNGTKYTSPEMTINGQSLSYSIPSGLLSLQGILKCQMVAKNNGTGVVWKSEVWEQHVDTALNAVTSFPSETPTASTVLKPLSYTAGRFCAYDSSTGRVSDSGYGQGSFDAAGAAAAAVSGHVAASQPTSFTTGNFATYDTAAKKFNDSGYGQGSFDAAGAAAAAVSGHVAASQPTSFTTGNFATYDTAAKKFNDSGYGQASFDAAGAAAAAVSNHVTTSQPTSFTAGNFVTYDTAAKKFNDSGYGQGSFDAAGAAATTMTAHTVAANPHPSYQQNKLSAYTGSTALGEGAYSQLQSGSASNTGLGSAAGGRILSGNNNVCVGKDAGGSGTSQSNNTYIGTGAGYSTASASGNVFLGYQAGYQETGGNKLYIANSNTALPLIKGDFAASTLSFNGAVNVTGKQNTPCVTAQACVGQTTDLQQWKDSVGTVKAAVDCNGVMRTNNLIFDQVFESGWKAGTLTADPATDTFTLANHGFTNGTPIEFDAGTGALPAAVAASVTVKAASASTDSLTLSSRIERGSEPNVLKVLLTTNSSDNLAVTKTDATNTINIALANATASKNTAAAIQTVVRALSTVGGIMVTNINCIANGNWDTAAIATGESGAVQFSGGGGVVPYNCDSSGGMYYNVINSSVNTFQICATLGGTTPVKIISTGTAGFRCRTAGITALNVSGLNLDADRAYRIVFYDYNYVRSTTSAQPSSWARLNNTSYNNFGDITASYPYTVIFPDQNASANKKFSKGQMLCELRKITSDAVMSSWIFSALLTDDKVTASAMSRNTLWTTSNLNGTNVTSIYFGLNASGYYFKNGLRVQAYVIQ